jgi:hypothetical protein
MYGYQVPQVTNKLLVSMKTTRTPSGKTEEFREIDEYRPSMTRERISTWP